MSVEMAKEKTEEKKRKRQGLRKVFLLSRFFCG